jgi:hypothetical protein
MAEERNLATARAPEAAGTGAEPTKEELQRRMEEARESITQTVNDIKETVTTQYENVRETISQTLDWREQFRRRPVAFAAGAGVAGLILGYSVGGVVFGGGGEDDLTSRYYGAEGDYEDEPDHVRTAGERSYAAQAITGGAYGSTAYAASAQPTADSASQAFERGVARQQSQSQPQPAKQDYDYAAGSADGVPSRPSYSSGYEAQATSSQAGSTQATAQQSGGEESDPDKPGLISRFKETKAYDRLQDEVGKLGERFVEELSKTAQNVVLPALLGKLKDMIGVDLSPQRGGAQSNRAGGGQQAEAGAGGGTNYGTGAGGYGKSI